MNENCVEIICLPLYSGTPAEGKEVPTNNGINLWKAGGRVRDDSEISILIPEKVKLFFPYFFPDAGSTFELRLPNYVTLTGRVAKDGNSILSTPSRDLGKWLLRQVLRIASGKVISYAILEKKGIDAVYVEKWVEGKDTFYKIFPAPVGEYENFMINGIKERKECPTVGSRAGFTSVQTDIKADVQDLSISAGSQIVHKAFGEGCVKSFDNDMIELEFEGMTKSFKYSWLIANKMIKVV